MNNEDRRQWIENDEGLYNRFKSSGLSMTEFIRQNRKFVDEVVVNVSSGKRRQHYLAYPDGKE
jgi:hypothetical protein